MTQENGLNRRVLLRRRPKGLPVEDDFIFTKEPTPDLMDGEYLVRNVYISLDPAQRGWMDDSPSYQPPIPLNNVVRASTVGYVVRSRSDKFAEGQFVSGLNGIEDYTLCSDESLMVRPISSHRPLSEHLSIFGGASLTAYFALFKVTEPKPGETILVTAAAGAVGSMVGQFAKIHGCRTIGIAGGKEKNKRLLDNFGYDVAINYQACDKNELAGKIAEVAPDGVDMVFENVGGDILDAGLMNLKANARVTLCGLISDYNRMDDPHGTRKLWQLIVKRARIQGFLLSDWFRYADEAEKDISRWFAEGKLNCSEDIVDGIDNFVPVFQRLFKSKNTGKLMLKIDSTYLD